MKLAFACKIARKLAYDEYLLMRRILTRAEDIEESFYPPYTSLLMDFALKDDLYPRDVERSQCKALMG